MDSTIYEDSPGTDTWIRIIIFLPSSLLLVTALFILKDNQPASLTMMLTAILVAFIIFFIIPTKYCILDSKLRISFRGSLYCDIPYETVVTVRASRWSTVGINFPTNMSLSNAVEIIRKNRLAIAITPSDRKVFIANFEEAYKGWHTGRGQNS